nr:hypothetical protein [Tanacetum cinerariifolium]
LRADQEESGSPYDTASEIKFIMSLVVSTIFGSLSIDQDMMGNTVDPFAISRFEAVDSHNKGNNETQIKITLTQSAKAIADTIHDEMDDLKAFATKPSDLLCSLQTELSFLFLFQGCQPGTINNQEGCYPARRIITSGEQSFDQTPPTIEPIPPISSALIVHPLEEKASEEKPSEDEPPFKRLKFLIPCPNIPSPTPLSLFFPQAAERKRKRSSEVLNQVFLKEDIMVDGIHTNLATLPGVEGSKGLLISEPKSRIFFYNRNFDMVFQKEEEFYLATTA